MFSSSYKGNNIPDGSPVTWVTQPGGDKADWREIAYNNVANDCTGLLYNSTFYRLYGGT
jgi:hypothetical protein